MIKANENVSSISIIPDCTSRTNVIKAFLSPPVVSFGFASGREISLRLDLEDQAVTIGGEWGGPRGLEAKDARVRERVQVGRFGWIS